VQAAVRITSDEDGCWSHVGFVRLTPYQKSQQLNLGVGCRSLGMAAHQLLHTLGMVHQTSRTDRDDFLDIRRENIPMSNSTFKVHFSDNDGLFHGTTFDYFSLMNLPPFAFSSDHPTILTKGDVRLSEFLGQRVGMTQLDAERIAEVYGCDAVKPTTPSRILAERLNAGMGYDDGNCKDVDYTGFVLNGRMADCMELAGAALCYAGQHKIEIAKNCKRACMQCLVGFEGIGRDSRKKGSSNAPKAPPRSRRPVTWTEDMGYYPMQLTSNASNASDPPSFLQVAVVSNDRSKQVPSSQQIDADASNLTTGVV